MKPNIVLLATISCFLLGCHSETDGAISAEEARTKAQIALIEKQKEKDEEHEICKTDHIKWIKDQIESVSEQGETGTLIRDYYCEKIFSTGCNRVFSCKGETNEFITTLKQKGYTVEATKDGVLYTHYVSWSNK